MPRDEQTAGPVIQGSAGPQFWWGGVIFSGSRDTKSLRPWSSGHVVWPCEGQMGAVLGSGPGCPGEVKSAGPGATALPSPPFSPLSHVPLPPKKESVEVCPPGPTPLGPTHLGLCETSVLGNGNFTCRAPACPGSIHQGSTGPGAPQEAQAGSTISAHHASSHCRGTPHGGDDWDVPQPG